MTAANATPADAPERRCENCQAILLGEHCYACGQTSKGLVRHFSSILGDFADTVFNIDSRVLRTVGPLFLRPGFLTLEYFAGRRVRYVTPVRLFVFLSLVMFFAIHGSLQADAQGDVEGFQFNGRHDNITDAKTVGEVEAMLAQARQQFAEGRRNLPPTPGADAGLLAAEEIFNERAREQIDYLRALAAARAAGQPPPPPPRRNSLNFHTNGKPWDPDSNPLLFAWLPDAGNRSLNERLRRARTVLDASDDERPVVDAIFRVLPQTLFVLLPVFALLLKLAYLFRRRLYMEHLLVALHSHSFIALAVTLIAAVAALRDWLAPATGFWNGLFGWLLFGLGAWIPLYLLLTQKRVYGQGWILTALKFSVLGLVYVVLMSLGIAAALLVGLLTL